MATNMTDASGNARDAAGLEDVIRAAARLAEQARNLANSVGQVGDRELAMLATIAEDVRDQVIAAERLKIAREDEVLAGLRRSAHRGVDLAFDLAGTVITAGSDAITAFANVPRGGDPARPAPAPADPNRG